MRLFRNEVQRIFCDRLVSDEDLSTVEGKLAEIIGSQWSECRDDALVDPIIFGDFERAVERLTQDAEDARSVTQRENELELDVVAAMASTRCRTAATPSMRPHESLRVS